MFSALAILSKFLMRFFKFSFPSSHCSFVLKWIPQDPPGSNELIKSTMDLPRFSYSDGILAAGDEFFCGFIEIPGVL